MSVRQPEGLHPPPPVTPATFWLLVASTAGLFAGISVVRLARGLRMADVTFSNTRLFELIAIEAILLLLWVPRLARGGWTLRCATLPWSARDVLRAVGLMVLSYLAIVATFVVTWQLDPALARQAAETRAVGHPSPWVVAIASVINPVFEELLYLGFAANVLRRKGAGVAVLASVALRLAVHLYQGPLVLVTILPVAIIFGLYYVRTGRLWPVIVAHGIVDALALGRLAYATA